MIEIPLRFWSCSYGRRRPALSDQPSPSARLLVAYLASAVQEVRERRPLSERSEWAIAHAKSQLEAEQAAMDSGGRSFTGRAAFVASATTRTPRIGSLILSVLASDGLWAQGSNKTGIGPLQAVSRDLDDLRKSDLDAAERVSRTISPIIDRLLAA